MKYKNSDWIRLGLVLTGISFSAQNAESGTPPPVPQTIDTSGLIDVSPSAEEQMVSGEISPTPENGAENPEDLLKSAPSIHGPSETAKAEAFQKSSKHSPEQTPDTLPLLPETAVSPLSPDLPPTPQSTPNTDTVPPAELTEQSTTKWDRSVPLYDRENPNLGIELHGSIQALGTSIKSTQLDGAGTPTGALDESNVRNFGLGFEYEPGFLQGIGVVSLGPSFNFYVLEPEGDLTKNAFSIYSFGGSIKYQLKFMRGQFLVPFVGFESQVIRYSFQNANLGEGTTTASGPTFGAMLLLNGFEPSASHSLWAESGIRRSYLFAEFKNLTAGEPTLSTDGTAIYFGIRVER